MKKSEQKQAVIVQKNQVSRFSVLVLCVLFSAIATLLTLRIFAQAAVASIFLEPASQTVTVGQNVTLNIKVNSGGQLVKSARANLTYPAAQFDFVSISTAGSAFDLSGTSTGGSGNISVTRNADNANNGASLHLASVTLRAKAAGTGTVAPQSTSYITHDDDYDIYNQSQSKSATITSSSPPSNLPPVPPPVSPTTPSNPTPSSPSQPRSTTSSPSSSRPSNSPSPSQQTPSSQQNSPAGEFESAALPAGTYSVELVISLENGDPATNAEVEAFGQTVTTNGEGIAHFDSVSPGYHIVNVLVGAQNHNDTVQVLEDGESTQTFRLQLGQNTVAAPDNKGAALKVVGIVLAVALVVSGVYLLWARKGGRDWYANGPHLWNSQPSAIENPQAAPLLQTAPTAKAEPAPQAPVVVVEPRTTPLSQLDERTIATPETQAAQEKLAIAEAAVAHAIAGRTEEVKEDEPQPAARVEKPAPTVRPAVKPRARVETKPSPEKEQKPAPKKSKTLKDMSSDNKTPFQGEMKITHDRSA